MAEIVKVTGPWPEYADAPAWEAAGVRVPGTYGGVCIPAVQVTASLGCVAQGDAGRKPRPGIYRDGCQGEPGSLLYNATRNRGWQFVRSATPAELTEAEAALASA